LHLFGEGDRLLQMNSPSISIVIPVLNEAPRLERTLSGLASQADELVLVDGGSLDGSAHLARQLGARVVELGRSGRALQMNAGAALSSGDILVFVHADVELPVSWRNDVMKALSADQSWGRFDVLLQSERWLVRLIGAAMNLRSRLTGIATGDQAMFMTRNAWNTVGGFPSIPLMEDVALSRRLKQTVGRPACLRSTVQVSARRWHEKGVWRTVFLMWSLRALYWAGVSPQRLHAWYYGRPAS
jgi:rSAM/selenodomain-associated transferase 2